MVSALCSAAEEVSEAGARGCGSMAASKPSRSVESAEKMRRCCGAAPDDATLLALPGDSAMSAARTV